jgi:hypothetical protein
VERIQNDLLGGDELVARVRDGGGDFGRDRGHAFRSPCSSRRVNGQSADAHRHVRLEHLDIAVRADRPLREDREVQGVDLLQVPAGAVGDQPDRAKGLVGRAHDLSKGGGQRRLVQILEDDHRRAGQLPEARHLIGQSGIRPLPAWRDRGAAGDGGREANHRRQLREAGPDARSMNPPCAADVDSSTMLQIVGVSKRRRASSVAAVMADMAAYSLG